jgi:hypothetical protein
MLAMDFPTCQLPAILKKKQILPQRTQRSQRLLLMPLVGICAGKKDEQELAEIAEDERRVPHPSAVSPETLALGTSTYLLCDLCVLLF